MTEKFTKNIAAIALEKREQKTIFSAFSEETLALAKDEFYEKSKEIARTELEFSAEKRAWTEKLKKLQIEKNGLMMKISEGGIDTLEELYLVPDFDNMTMERYRENGEYYDSRRMTPEERQTRVGDIINISADQKTGTDNRR